MRIGLEPLNRFETYFLNRCDQALALAEEVGGDCGVALDAFHMNIEEADLLAAIRAAGDRLVDFHVADNNRMPPRLRRDRLGRRSCASCAGSATTATDRRVRRPVDRTPPISDRTEIGDASEAGGGVAMEKFLRDHSHRRRRRSPTTTATPRTRSTACARRSRPTRRRRSERMPAVALIGTLDTKGEEIAYVRDRLPPSASAPW